jgi:hypothetical protein
MEETPKTKTTKQEKSKKVTYVAFNREQGVQVRHPGGKFLRYIRKSEGENINSGTDGDYHIVGITDVFVHDYGLTIVLDGKINRHFPFASIASFTEE